MTEAEATSLTEGGDVAPDRRAWMTMAVAGASFFVVSLDLTIVSLAFPEIAREFEGTSLATLSWIATGYNIALAALFLVAGRLADLRGRRLVFITGMSIFVGTSALAGLAPAAWWIIAARILQGAGGALLIPSSLALVLPRFPPSRRSMAIALWGALGASAAALAPSLGAVLIDGFGWRSVFLVNLPIGAAVIVATLRLIPESRDEDAARRFDLVGVASGTLGVAALVLAISQGDEWGWTSPVVVALGAAGVVLVVHSVRRSLVHPTPLIDVSMFRIRSYAVAIGLSALFAVVFLAFWFVMPLFFRDAWEWSTLPDRPRSVAGAPPRVGAGRAVRVTGRPGGAPPPPRRRQPRRVDRLPVVAHVHGHRPPLLDRLLPRHGAARRRHRHGHADQHLGGHA